MDAAPSAAGDALWAPLVACPRCFASCPASDRAIASGALSGAGAEFIVCRQCGAACRPFARQPSAAAASALVLGAPAAGDPVGGAGASGGGGGGGGRRWLGVLGPRFGVAAVGWARSLVSGSWVERRRVLGFFSRGLAVITWRHALGLPFDQWQERSIAYLAFRPQLREATDYQRSLIGNLRELRSAWSLQGIKPLFPNFMVARSLASFALVSTSRMSGRGAPLLHSVLRSVLYPVFLASRIQMVDSNILPTKRAASRTFFPISDHATSQAPKHHDVAILSGKYRNSSTLHVIRSLYDDGGPSRIFSGLFMTNLANLVFIISHDRVERLKKRSSLGRAAVRSLSIPARSRRFVLDLSLRLVAAIPSLPLQMIASVQALKGVSVSGAAIELLKENSAADLLTYAAVKLSQVAIHFTLETALTALVR